MGEYPDCGFEVTPEFLALIFNKVGNTTPWPSIPRISLTSLVPFLPRRADNGFFYLTFDVNDSTNPLSNCFHAPVPFRGRTVNTVRNFKLAVKAAAYGGGPEGYKCVLGTRTLEHAEGIVSTLHSRLTDQHCICSRIEEEQIVGVFLKFLHHSELRSALLFTETAHIAACSNTIGPVSESCGLSVEEYDPKSTYPLDNKLGEALMGVRELFKSLSEEEILETLQMERNSVDLFCNFNLKTVYYK